MDKIDTDFDTWFGVLQANVLDRTGVNFEDAATTIEYLVGLVDAHRQGVRL